MCRGEEKNQLAVLFALLIQGVEEQSLIFGIECLLSSSHCRNRQALRVREHNVFGPYVDGLSRLAVACYKVLWGFLGKNYL